VLKAWLGALAIVVPEAPAVDVQIAVSSALPMDQRHQLV
jgi:hypothetical protein